MPSLIFALCSLSPSVLAAHLQLLLPLQRELLEGLDDKASIGAVVHEDRRAAHPGLQVVDGQRDVLRVVLQDSRAIGAGLWTRVLY